MKRIFAAVLWEPLPVSTHVWRRVNEFLWRIWLALGIYTVATPLKNSIPWLAFMSVYAIVASHLAGARADAPTEETDRS